jgi:polyphenol oxidase
VPARFLLTDRHAGVSPAPYDGRNLGSQVGDDPVAVAENRRRVAERAGLAAGRLVFMNQVHGRTVALVHEPQSAPEADALVTTTPGLGLVVLVADCTPVLLAGHDATGRAVGVAVAHAGRRGMALGVVPAAVAALVELGAPAEHTVVRVGPAICGACYEVPADLADEIAAIAPAARALSRSGTPAIDIRAGILAQLRDAGVHDIEVDPRCTRESPELYSYRRDHVTGRFAGLAWLAA